MTTLGILSSKGGDLMSLILWIIAVVLVISGIVTIVRGGLLMGIVLIVVGLLVGPGGVSLFTK
jgi:hypothetical protein